jgi:hypothetical protein
VTDPDLEIQMNVKALMLAAALVIPTAAAHAETWVVANASERRCQPASTIPWSTPLKYEQAARDQGDFIKTEIDRADDGSVRMVAVHVRLPSGRETAIVFMHDLAECNFAMKRVLGTKGDLD